MLTLYDKNIAANMDDIDDNDRTMTWENFFGYDQPTHPSTHVYTDDDDDFMTQIALKEESTHNEQRQQQVAKTKSRTGTFKCLSFSIPLSLSPSYDKLCETKYNLALIRSVFVNVMK